MFDENLCERLKDRRKELSLSRDQMAEMLYISKDTYIKWEQGKNTPRLPELFSLAEILQTSVAYLVGEKKENATMNYGRQIFDKLSVLSENAAKPVFYKGMNEVVNGWSQHSLEYDNDTIAREKSNEIPDQKDSWDEKNTFLPMVNPETNEVYAIRDYGMYEPLPSDVMLYTDCIPFKSSELGPNERFVRELADAAVFEYKKAIQQAKENAGDLLPAILIDWGSRNNYFAYSIEEKKPFVVLEYKNFLDTCMIVEYDDNTIGEPRKNDKYYILPPTEEYINALGLDITYSVLSTNWGWDKWREMPTVDYANASEPKWKDNASKYIDVYNKTVDFINMGRKHEFKTARAAFGRLESRYAQFNRVLNLWFAPAKLLEDVARMCEETIGEITTILTPEARLICSIYGNEKAADIYGEKFIKENCAINSDQNC